jgi:hypothetical protein
MRISPVLVLLTLATSTASMAAPIAHSDGVAPRVVQIGLGPADLVGDLLTTARATATFSMLGLTWSGAGDLPLAVRTHTRGAWTDWQQLERDDDGPAPSSVSERGLFSAGPEDNPGQAATAPLWVGPSDGFQVRVDRTTGMPVPLPTRLNLALIDPGNSPHDAATVQPAVVDRGVAAGDLPPIGTRKDWNANERMRHRAPRYTGGIQVAFVHHTAGGNHYSESDVPKIIRGVYAFHTRVRGWSDVGYNFLVDRFGRIWEGRAGGVDRPVLGAHTGGFNSDSFGVAVLGNFVHDRPTPATLDAIERVIAWKFSHYGQAPGLDPQSDTRLVSAGGGTDRWRRGRSVNFLRISGHRDAGSTECPGRYLYAKLDEIRQRVWYLQHTGQVAEPGTQRAPFPAGSETGQLLLEHLFQPPKADDPSVRDDWAQQRPTKSGVPR